MMKASLLITEGSVQYGHLSAIAQGGYGGIHCLRRAILFTLIIGIALGMMVPSFFVTNAKGAVVNKIVYGVVYDQIDQFIPGADVVVEIWAGDWPEQDFIRITTSTVTDQSGSYEVEISSNYWDPHNTIRVIVTYDLVEESRKVEADADEYQEVNMWIDIVVPEFASGTMLLGIMSAIVVVIICAKRSFRRKP